MDAQKVKARRGFAAIAPEKQREIARMGGRAVAPARRSFSQDRALAARAGAAGGRNRHRGKGAGGAPGEPPREIVETPAAAPRGDGAAVRAPASAAPADDERRRFRGPGSQAAQAAGTPVPAADRAPGGR